MQWHWSIRCLICLISVVCSSSSARIPRHSSTDVARLNRQLEGFNEPGLWRTVWVMDRMFYDKGPVGQKVDRIYFKFMPDRSIKVLNADRRARALFAGNWLQFARELWKTKGESGSGKESTDLVKEENIDGSYLFTPLKRTQSRIDFDLIEGSRKERVKHTVNLNIGKQDPYSAIFETGKIQRFKLLNFNIPYFAHEVGEFTLSANPHRLLVGKDFQAFQ